MTGNKITKITQKFQNNELAFLDVSMHNTGETLKTPVQRKQINTKSYLSYYSNHSIFC